MTTTEIANTIREGERVKVRLPNGTGGLVFVRGEQFVMECHEGFAEGVTEAICFNDSPYIETYLQHATIWRNLGGWVKVQEGATQDEADRKELLKVQGLLMEAREAAQRAGENDLAYDLLQQVGRVKRLLAPGV